MTLSLPSYITAESADPNLRFAWDDSDTEVAEGKTDTALVDRLARLSQRADVAWSIALAEWIVGRFRPFPGIESSFQYGEACWATAIDLRYCGVVWEDFPHQDKWTGPVRGPLGLAMLRLQETIGSLVEGGDPEYTASKLWQLALHVAPRPATIRDWGQVMLERMEQRFPRLSEDPLGDVVPREFFDPNTEGFPSDTAELVNHFLGALDPRENPFLNTPQRMLEQGFPGRPYAFDLASDRIRRVSPGKAP